MNRHAQCTTACKFYKLTNELCFDGTPCVLIAQKKSGMNLSQIYGAVSAARFSRTRGNFQVFQTVLIDWGDFTEQAKGARLVRTAQIFNNL